MSGRRLLVVSSLVTHGPAALSTMYRAAELASILVARALVGLRYRELCVLRGEAATSEAFVSKLDALTHADGTVAVDVLLHLHGDPSALAFADGFVDVRTIARRVRGRVAPNRLRLLYSTACYGAAHAEAFLEAGFRVVSGARGTNTNGVYDYVVELAAWAVGLRYRSALRAGNLRPPLRLFDAIARRTGFPDADSYKDVRGDSSLRIGSPPIAGRIAQG